MMLYVVLELHLIGLGQSLVVFLVVGLPLIIPARLGFQDLIFVSFSFFVLSSRCIFHRWLRLSLVALHFTMFSTPGLDSAWKIISCLKLELCFFVVGFNSRPPLCCFSSFPAFLGICVWSLSLGVLVSSIQSLVVLHWHGLLVL
ncbi:hypothetical protein IGI04_007251 [Brassica rapa subsp. trilocularis]|uniref:Transmembrane protein n=1 Tax=Brassica rapa subsp. trilocularis TaxID=1813537 RepID=A0ABQ7NJ79_BRACM|nr:hypothetical protein IGI04_007251 [Brassica rapa subsp. trilocularis]